MESGSALMRLVSAWQARRWLVLPAPARASAGPTTSTHSTGISAWLIRAIGVFTVIATRRR